jgi:hypothetical protein
MRNSTTMVLRRTILFVNFFLIVVNLVFNNTGNSFPEFESDKESSDLFQLGSIFYYFLYFYNFVSYINNLCIIL